MTPTTSPRRALALLALLLALTLTPACGAKTAATPPPDVVAHEDPCASLPALAPCLAQQPQDPVAHDLGGGQADGGAGGGQADGGADGCGAD